MRGLRPVILSRRAILIAAALLIAVPAWSTRADEAKKPVVRLIVDYGDGASKAIDNLPWAKGNTVLDAMKEATSRPHGISFGYTGTGDSAMLTKIDDVGNEGSGAGKKNWQFWVNGNYGDRSFAAFELQAEDVVLWRFGVEQGK